LVNKLFIQKKIEINSKAWFRMENSLYLKFLGIGTNAIKARNSTDEGIIHGILLQNDAKELAIFISTIGFIQNGIKEKDIDGVIGGFTLEDLKEHLDKLKKENWMPLGLVQIDIGEKAVEEFLKGRSQPFAVINLIKDLKTEKINYQKKNLEKNYLSFYL